MERILKAIGVGIFWYYGSIWVAGIVLGYLILLSLFRTVTRGQDDRIGVIEGQMATE
jgi:TRAP-type C4-dicarboxylate transport system permease small subunit